jgi:hypothetical protein
MPPHIRLASSTTESEQRLVRRHVEFLACRSHEFYAHVRMFASAHMGVTPEWLDRAVEAIRPALGRMVISRPDENDHAA